MEDQEIAFFFVHKIDSIIIHIESINKRHIHGYNRTHIKQYE
jgi:hypothetical protein